VVASRLESKYSTQEEVFKIRLYVMYEGFNTPGREIDRVITNTPQGGTLFSPHVLLGISALEATLTVLIL